MSIFDDLVDLAEDAVGTVENAVDAVEDVVNAVSNTGGDLIDAVIDFLDNGTVPEIGDAGQLLTEAQIIPSVEPTLDSITGNLSSNNDVDLFQVTLTGGGTFSATTQGTDTTVSDPQLFLFDENGFGVFGNDDFNSLQPTLPAETPLTPLEPGTYFLAISSFNNDPVSSFGEIFASSDQFGQFGSVLETTGPGGGAPLSGFTDAGGSTGSYTIALTGVEAASPFSLF